LVLFNYALKELTAKIVYYGPGLSGKTSNLQYIYEELPIKNKGRMLTLATETDRTLYFDFLPVDAGVVRGIKTRVQLYTVPGQVFYNATRRMVLKGADGVVFVADSQKSMVEANLESFENLRENLKAHDLKIEEMPLILQFNKRDLKEIATLEEMNDSLNPMNGPFYEAVAKDGIGVEETLQAISGLVLKSVIDRYGGDRAMTPLGGRAPAQSAGGSARAAASADPARTDPDALVSAAAMIAGSEAGKATSGGSPPRGKDPKPKPSAWPSPPKEEKVASKDSNPLEAFESLNIEGILDEALRLDEPPEEPVRPASRAKPKAAPPPPPVEEEDDSMFSGLLDEALGVKEAEALLDDVLGGGGGPVSSPHSTKPPRPDSDPMREIEVELLGESLEPVEDEGDGHPHLSELIKTRVTIPKGRHITNPPVKEEAKPAGPIEVPITLHIDASAGEQDIELLLKIRLKRK
jgi:signal recognition particle receptor subunit beta